MNEAVQDAIVKGLLLFPAVVDIAAAQLAALPWANPDHARLVEGLLSIRDDSYPNMPADIDPGLQKYGVSDIAVAVRMSTPLRFPFLTTTDPVAGEKLLAEAILSTANPRR